MRAKHHLKIFQGQIQRTPIAFYNQDFRSFITLRHFAFSRTRQRKTNRSLYQEKSPKYIQIQQLNRFCR